MKVSIIGAGTVGKSIADAIKDDFEISLSSSSFEKLKAWNNNRFKIFNNNVDNSNYGDIIILTVKPDIIDKVLDEIKSNLKNKIVISFIAGIKIDYIKKYLDSSIIVRAMPNIPMLIKKSVTAYCYENIDNDSIITVKKILSDMGTHVEINESYMDAVTGLSGSGPAFIAIMIDSMINAGIYAGIHRDKARKLVMDTFYSTLQLLNEKNISPSDLRDEVMTPGGTTVSGIYELEKGNIRTAITNAVMASYKKAKEISEYYTDKKL